MGTTADFHKWVINGNKRRSICFHPVTHPLKAIEERESKLKAGRLISSGG